MIEGIGAVSCMPSYVVQSRNTISALSDIYGTSEAVDQARALCIGDQSPCSRQPFHGEQSRCEVRRLKEDHVKPLINISRADRIWFDRSDSGRT